MFIEFDQMPPQSRVWIYQSNRPLTEEETTAVQQRLQAFIENWVAHQKSLKASGKVFYGRFLIISLDESHNAASGCSIDASVHFLRMLEQEFDLSLFERTNVAFLKDKDIQTETVHKLKEKIAEGTIHQDTLVFNNLVDNIQDLQSNWPQPAKDTWLARYF